MARSARTEAIRLGIVGRVSSHRRASDLILLQCKADFCESRFMRIHGGNSRTARWRRRERRGGAAIRATLGLTTVRALTWRRRAWRPCSPAVSVDSGPNGLPHLSFFQGWLSSDKIQRRRRRENGYVPLAGPIHLRPHRVPRMDSRQSLAPSAVRRHSQ